MSDHVLPEAQRALDRMRVAHKRGTGVRLTAEMVRQLGLSSIGQMWEQDLDDSAWPTREGGAA